MNETRMDENRIHANQSGESRVDEARTGPDRACGKRAGRNDRPISGNQAGETCMNMRKNQISKSPAGENCMKENQASKNRADKNPAVETRRCWAQIDLDALRHNFRLVKQCAGSAAVMAVVKADAYGHGDAVVAPLLEKEGADAFAVACLDEALRLRRAGVTKPVLILGYTGAENAATLAAHDLRQTVFSPEYAAALSAAAVRTGVTVRVHLKIDTGMARLGFAPDDVEGAARAAALPGLSAQGIFTHFAAADSEAPPDKEYTRRQYALLCGMVDALAARGLTFPVRHCCNSAGTFAWPEYHLDFVRPGIILYGEQPSPEVTLPGLCGAMQLCAVVSQVRTLSPGDAVSYGCTYHAPHTVRAATLTIGYADGYPRALSSRGTVSLHGRPARVLGRVCMDQIVVDVTEIPGTQPGDTAIVFGGAAADSVADVAAMTGTIGYEVLCGVGRRVPRVYIENGARVASMDYLAGTEAFPAQESL